MEMTTAYATFANGGKRAEPYAVLEIRRPNGDVIYARSQNAPAAPQVVPESLVADLNSMLHEVVVSGTGRRAFLGFTPQAGKTGTNQSYRDAWFIGFTAHYVTGVWFGNDDFSEMKKVTGGLLPAELWKRFMLEAEATKVAAALPGVPLDDSYAKYLAENQGKLDLPILPTAAPSNADEIRETTEVAAVETPAEVSPSDPVVAKRKKQQNAVVEVLQGMFSLFKSSDARASDDQESSSGVFVFSPSSSKEHRAKRITPPGRRSKDLLEGR
jgi:penicillin-binding protein 1A